MIWWIVGTVSGWLLGAVAAALLSIYVHLATAQDVAVFDVVIVGLFVGFLQWRLSLKNIVNPVAWILAIVFANTLIVIAADFAQSHRLIPQIFDYSVGRCFECDVARLHETWFSGTVVPSLITGFAGAIPTAIVLSRYWSRL